jgi:hypothetical protein
MVSVSTHNRLKAAAAARITRFALRLDKAAQATYKKRNTVPETSHENH